MTPPVPVVSVAVPMRDELGAIGACLDSFEAQDHPLDRLDVMVIDGGSTDGSRELVEDRARTRPWLRIVDNPVGSAAAAFNLGLAEARGEIVCLFSAHGVAAPTYVSRSVAVLAETGAAGVGGRYLHVGTDRTSRAVGLAMVSPFGMASPHRFADRRREVDTISHPAYRRDAALDAGWFDERLARNSDYEFNHRMRQAGHRLVFDPSIESIYRPRPSLGALGRQFWWYGRWKARVARRHHDSVRVRHLVAPAAVLGAAVSPLAWRSPALRPVVAGAWGLYAAGVTAATVAARPGRLDASAATLAGAFPVMHAAWGAGFVISVVEDAVGRGPSDSPWRPIDRQERRPPARSADPAPPGPRKRSAA